MDELFEELKHHDFEEIYFVAERYEVHLSDGITIITMDSQQMLKQSKRHRIVMLVPTTLREVAVNANPYN